MTDVVIGDVLPYTQAIAIASQTIFMTNWTANVESDVVVFYTPAGSTPDDQTQVLSYPSEYSVAFIGASQEVQVTLVTPANAGDIVTITRMTPADRMNLYSNTNFTPTMLNNDFGILTLVDQQAQLVNQLIAPRYNYSAIIAPNSSFPNANIILPILGANEIWMMNSNMTAIIAVPFNGGGGSGGGVDPALINNLAWYAATGDQISGLPTSANGVLVTDAGGVPSISSTLPLPVQNNISELLGVTGYIQAPVGIKDANGNIVFGIVAIPSAVNYLVFQNNATGSGPAIQTGGTDTDVPLLLQGKGTAGVQVEGSGTDSPAPVGYVGEDFSLNLPFASAISLTTTTSTDILSQVLQPGNYDIWGNVFFATGSNAAVVTTYNGWTNTVSATQTDNSYAAVFNIAAMATCGFPISGTTLKVAHGTTATVYLSCLAIFASGSVTACGNLFIRRRY